MSLLETIYDFYHLSKKEKQKMEIPDGLEPLHEEIWRSIQQEEANTTPKSMSREATCELMRILDVIDYEKSTPSSVQMDEELKIIMELAQKYKE